MEKVRPLEKLPLKTKLAYCKILALMLSEDSELDQLKLAALYRLMANIKITTIKRQDVLLSIGSSNTLEELYQQLNIGLNQQEKNIVRFSIYKDILIIMQANHLELPEEVKLLSKVEEILEITEDQKNFIVAELEGDKRFYEEEAPEGYLESATHEAIASAAAVGVPLLALHYSSFTGNLGLLGIVSGLHTMGKKISKRHSLMAGIGLSIGIALISYKATKLLLKCNNRKSDYLKDMMAERLQEIHDLAIDYLDKDILLLQDKTLAENPSIEGYSSSTTTLLLKLRKAKAYLEGTKPMCI